MDAGEYTFVLDIPSNFQRDMLAGRSPAIQLNVDATRMSQAFTGSSYIQQMVQDEVSEFVQRYRGSAPPPVDLALRSRFNPNLEQAWFGSLMEIINNVILLSIILAGAALCLFATTSMGIFMATLARLMLQFGMLAVLILLPLQMLSGGSTPRESMPAFVQNLMMVAPTTHFVAAGQAILFCGAGLSAVWPQFLALAAIGAAFFAIALTRFRKTIGTMV